MTSRLNHKRRLGWLYRLFPSASRRRVVLLYHSVGDGPWSISARDFEQQCRYIAETAQIVTTDIAATEEMSSSPLSVAMSFDDGYACLLDVANPIVREYGIPPTVFVSTALLDAESRRLSDPTLGHYPSEHFLTWPDLLTLLKDGWHVGSHGVDHVDLTKLADTEAHEQVATSRAQIELNTGLPCRSFAFTWGRHNRDTRARLSKAGYKHAYAAHHAPITSNADAFALPRLNIDRHYDFDDFKAVVRGDWDYLAWLNKLKNRS